MFYISIFRGALFITYKVIIKIVRILITSIVSQLCENNIDISSKASLTVIIRPLLLYLNDFLKYCVIMSWFKLFHSSNAEGINEVVRHKGVVV